MSWEWIHEARSMAAAMIDASLQRGWKVALGLLLAAYIVEKIWVALGPGLGKIPGPFVARFSRLYLLNEARKENGYVLYRGLHETYGKIVRVGPRKVSIADPEMIPVIYGVASKFAKTGFYDVFTTPHEGRFMDNLFTTRDMAFHKRLKSTVAHAYSLSSLRQLEPLVDSCTELFVDSMREFASQGKEVDFGEWLQWYAFDVIGSITFSQTFGFMAHRQDRNGIIQGIEKGLAYGSLIGHFPGLHGWLLGNQTLLNIMTRIPALAKSNPIVLVNEMAATAMEEYDSSTRLGKQTGDFLGFLKEVQKKDPQRLSDRDLLASIFTNLFAGSDTTAMSLRAIFYFLVQTPRVYQKLMEEIDQTANLSPVIEYSQGTNMKYLNMVIKESMRLHPGVGLPLERYVPEGGAQLAGVFLPGGTTVGIHAWVVQRDPNIYGPDPDAFRPERWGEEEASPEQLKLMERSFFAFGHGSRSCIGKNIALLEMTKFVPQVLRAFDLQWASSRDGWQIAGNWFAKQTGLILRLKNRTQRS